MSNIVPIREAQALGALSEAKRQIALARETGDIETLKEWRDRAAAIQHYAQARTDAKGIAADAGEVKVRAEAALGRLDRHANPHGGDRTEKQDSPPETCIPDVAPATRANWRKLGEADERGELDALIEELREDEDAGVTTAAAVRKVRKSTPPPEKPKVEPATGTYSAIVIDPPWPMQKIDRDVRPNQGAALDYPPMSPDELRELVIPAADDAHLYLWTTHKFLPLALELADVWGFRYQCLLTWVKNVGFTPFSFMYSTEHALFCRRGNLDLLVKGKRLDFSAKVREHSRKPDEFYELVRTVSPGPRIDMFSRERRDGFDQWGNEPERFADVA